MLSRVTSPTRKQQVSRYRRYAVITLAVGAAVALASAYWSTPIGWIGAAAVVVAALIALRFSWREVKTTRVAGHRDLMLMESRARDVRAKERRIEGLVRDRLRDTNVSLVDQVSSLRAELAADQRELSKLRGDAVALTEERDRLRVRVEELTALVEKLELQVDGDLDLDSAAEVLSLPRRVRRHQRALWDDTDVWATGEMPSVSDLVQADAEAGVTPVYEAHAQ